MEALQHLPLDATAPVAVMLCWAQGLDVPVKGSRGTIARGHVETGGAAAPLQLPYGFMWLK